MMKQLSTKTEKVNKFNFKPLLLITLLAAITYTSCRKNESSLPYSAPSKATTDTLSGQIALNLAMSLNGKFGGVNLMDGVDSVSLTGHNGPQHGYNNASLCGFFTDSLVNFDKTVGDTTTHTGGNLTFYFDCKDGQPTGYTAYDSLNTVRTTPKGTNEYYVKQYYTIQSLDAKHEFIGVNGDLYYYNSSIIKCGCGQTVTTIENANYVLKDLTINVCGCSRDILSGTATFKAYGKNWSLTGSITFKGNHMADVVFDGNSTVYHVNLLTHKITV